MVKENYIAKLTKMTDLVVVKLSMWAGKVTRMAKPEHP